MRRDVFQAIADPTRRKIISMISKKSLNINAVAENFEVSRTAIYKHLKILSECGLVVMKQQGRERFCEARLQNLNKVSAWVDSTVNSGALKWIRWIVSRQRCKKEKKVSALLFQIFFQ